MRCTGSVRLAAAGSGSRVVKKFTKRPDGVRWQDGKNLKRTAEKAKNPHSGAFFDSLFDNFKKPVDNDNQKITLDKRKR